MAGISNTALMNEILHIKKIVTGDGNGEKGHSEKIRDNRAELDRHENDIGELKEFVKEVKPIVEYVKELKSARGKWENRAWGIIQSIVLLVVGALLGSAW